MRTYGMSENQQDAVWLGFHAGESINSIAKGLLLPSHHVRRSLVRPVVSGRRRWVGRPAAVRCRTGRTVLWAGAGRVVSGSSPSGSGGRIQR